MRAKEHVIMDLYGKLKTFKSDYRPLCAITRLIWKTCLLLTILKKIINNHDYYYNLTKSEEFSFFKRYIEKHNKLLENEISQLYLEIFKVSNPIFNGVHEVPNNIAKYFNINLLENSIRNTLKNMHKTVLFFYDGLDEGWGPNVISTSIIGGLAKATSDFIDHQSSIYGVMFVRDNMFRSLLHFDFDFSRHIEGSTLRLTWDKDSLLQFIANRLRYALDIQRTENNIKVWNRFAYKDLRGRTGFENCLKNTLYRPRDILVLLNQAYNIALKGGRETIIDDDVEVTSKNISQNRLYDLLKEYEIVFPGLNNFIKLFHGKPAIDSFYSIQVFLNEHINSEDYSELGSGDFAIYNSGKEMFFALYSIGFIGLKDKSKNEYKFCHDGSQSDIHDIDEKTEVMIHPCYWKALEATSIIPSENVMIQINDEYKTTVSTEDIKDYRTKRIGKVITDLNDIKLGFEGYKDFEDWVLRTIKILFSGKLSNIELQPNPDDGVQKRDVIATNMSKDGFWRRIWEDYNSRQVVFDAKNYIELKPNDFKQMACYLTGHYGNFGVIVTRSQNEGIGHKERDWIKEIYDTQKNLY